MEYKCHLTKVLMIYMVLLFIEANKNMEEDRDKVVGG